MSKPRKGKKVKYNLRNWSKYNNALRQRGQIVFMLTSDIKNSWLIEGPDKKEPGGQPKFTDLAIETCLRIRELFHLPLRQTEGFICGLFAATKIDLDVPDYTLLSKRAENLNIKIQTYKSSDQKLPDEPLCVTMDSTGLKIYGEGEWLNEKHKTKMHKSWRKAHIAKDQHGQIVAASLTSNSVGDPTEAVNLLDQINGNIDEFQGDGAYDAASLHTELESRYPGIKIITPPRKDAVIGVSQDTCVNDQF